MWTAADWIFPPCRDFQRFQSCLAAASWQQSYHFSPFSFSQDKGPRSLQVARSQQSCRHGSEQQALTLPAHIPSPMAPASPFPPCHPQPPLLAPYLLPIPSVLSLLLLPTSALAFPWLLPLHTHTRLPSHSEHSSSSSFYYSWFFINATCAVVRLSY